MRSPALSPSSAPSLALPRLGIVGGGQLAKMTALAGFELGCEVVILERNTHGPASRSTSHTIAGDWDNPEALAALGARVDVVTIENEFVDARSLAALEKLGHPLFPTAATLALVQDKLTQKQTVAQAGVPVPRYRAVSSESDIAAAGQDFGWPIVLKTRRNGYDGKGNATLRSAADLPDAWRKLGAGSRGLYVEEFCPYDAELAVILTRARDGQLALYPVVESVQKDHICHIVKAPASIPAEVEARAVDIARRAIESIQGVGSFGIEMFLLPGGQVVFNELAPRVHNSGHYTIEACVCSQFENHVRAVLGWPLGSPAMVAPAAVMVNLLGAASGPGRPAGLDAALAVPGARLHIYGKTVSSPGRKMGHVTALGSTIEEALATAQRAAQSLIFGTTA